MNNDQLAYRVYDTIEQKYLDLSRAVFLGQDGKLYFPAGNGGWQSDESGRYIVERATGVKDKKGKLIYAGDILKSGEDFYRCYWVPQKACFSFRNIFDKYELFDRDFSRRHWQIIGNIHEVKK